MAKPFTRGVLVISGDAVYYAPTMNPIGKLEKVGSWYFSSKDLQFLNEFVLRDLYQEIKERNLENQS